MVELAGTVTLAGVDIVAADVEVEPMDTTEPPEGAGPERTTVHRDEPGAVTEVGVQARLLSETEGGWPLMVTAAPEPEAAIAAPAPEAALALNSWMELDVAVVESETVKVAVARVPSEIAVVLKPLARHIYCPEAGALQVRLFPGPVAAGPAVTDTLVKSAEAKENVHWRPAA